MWSQKELMPGNLSAVVAYLKQRTPNGRGHTVNLPVVDGEVPAASAVAQARIEGPATDVVPRRIRSRSDGNDPLALSGWLDVCDTPPVLARTVEEIRHDARLGIVHAFMRMLGFQEPRFQQHALMYRVLYSVANYQGSARLEDIPIMREEDGPQDKVDALNKLADLLCEFYGHDYNFRHYDWQALSFRLQEKLVPTRVLQLENAVETYREAMDFSLDDKPRVFELAHFIVWCKYYGKLAGVDFPSIRAAKTGREIKPARASNQ